MRKQEIDPQIVAHRRRLQMDVLIKEGDYKKNEQRKNQLNVKIRQAQRKMSLLKIEIEKDKSELEKFVFSQMTLSKEIKKLKKDIMIMQ